MHHARLLLLASSLALGCHRPAQAQEQPPPAQQQPPAPAPDEPVEEKVRKLQRKILVEGGTEGEQAATDLFLTGVAGKVELGPEGSHDAFLLGVLADESTKPAARMSILKPLRIVGRWRLEPACRFALEAMDDGTPTVAAQAVTSFAALDDDRGSVYRWARNVLTNELNRARPDTPRGRQQAGLIEALERMPNPIQSVDVLITVLETKRLARGLEQRARESLQRLTARDFDGAPEWRSWYSKDPGTQNLSLAEWRLEVLRRRDERLRRFEGAAERYFAKMLAACAGDPEAQRRELQAALTDPDTVFGVRRVAIKELGALGKQNEWAVNLLRSRLGQAASFEYDETRALVIEYLGETGSAAVFDDVIQFLPATYHSRMRMAAAKALGKLQSPRGVDLLLVILDDLTAPDELLEEAIDALGQIKQNPDGRVAGALVRFARGLRPQNGNGNPGVPQPAATSLLAAVARTLGALPYASGAEVQLTIALLAELAAFESGSASADTNVRLAGATALGQVNHPETFDALAARLGIETEPRIRRAIADGIGQTALDDTRLVPRAIELLLPLLRDADETVKRKSHVKLEELVRAPGLLETFVGFELLVTALNEKAFEAATIVSFLAGERGLPAVDTLTPAQLQPPIRPRYFNLVAQRAKAQLESAPAAALADYRQAIEGLQLSAPASPPARALHLGKARALLRLPPPATGASSAVREALVDTLLPCLRATQAPDELAELWPVTLEAAERLKALDPAELAQRLPELKKIAVASPATPADVRPKLEALLP